MKHVKYGKCVKCGKEYEATPNLTNCECGGILDIKYTIAVENQITGRHQFKIRVRESMR